MTCLFATEGYLRLFIFFEKNWLFKVFLLCQQGLVTTMVIFCIFVKNTTSHLYNTEDKHKKPKHLNLTKSQYVCFFEKKTCTYNIDLAQRTIG